MKRQRFSQITKDMNLYLEKKNLSFETVLSSNYKIDILRKAKSEGYFIKCVFVLTSHPSINVNRVCARVVSGGHNVDRDKIIRRYYKSVGNIKVLIKICDILHVYDNTVKPVRIIRKHKNDIKIFPNELWSNEMILELL
ncbi:MAG: hypothetical protein LUH47_06445 [Clostridiales bacterium]|nr:hypothetical protein [Clostridiales bacterium]